MKVSEKPAEKRKRHGTLGLCIRKTLAPQLLQGCFKREGEGEKRGPTCLSCLCINATNQMENEMEAAVFRDICRV